MSATLTDKYGLTYDVIRPAGGEYCTALCRRHIDGKEMELHWVDLRPHPNQATAYYGIVALGSSDEWKKKATRTLREMRRELYARSVRVIV